MFSPFSFNYYFHTFFLQHVYFWPASSSNKTTLVQKCLVSFYDLSTDMDIIILTDNDSNYNTYLIIEINGKLVCIALWFNFFLRVNLCFSCSDNVWNFHISAFPSTRMYISVIFTRRLAYFWYIVTFYFSVTHTTLNKATGRVEWSLIHLIQALPLRQSNSLEFTIYTAITEI